MQKELQNIFASFMMNEKTNIDLIKYNAKLVGGLIGASEKFITDNKDKLHEDLEF